MVPTRHAGRGERNVRIAIHRHFHPEHRYCNVGRVWGFVFFMK